MDWTKEPEVMERVRQHISDDAARLMQWCGVGTASPIEAIMGAALLAEKMKRDAPMIVPPCVTLDIDGLRRNDTYGDGRWMIFAQVQAGAYRADFVVRHDSTLVEAPPWLVAVECDGHDFHDRTKAQASRDRHRDRHFQSIGLIVARFTGADIWRDARKCAVEVFDLAVAADDRSIRQDYARSL